MGAHLRLLSWNVFDENPDPFRVSACLRENVPDLVVLQEALPTHIDCVRSVFPHVITAKDYIRRRNLCHLVIASHFGFSNEEVIRHFDDDKAPASPMAWLHGWVEFLETVAVSVCFPNGAPLRVVALHTTAACGPGQRRREVSAAAANVPHSGPCFVAGDFNCFASPLTAPLLALPLAYTWRDLRCRERPSLDRWFERRGFLPLVHGVTFPAARLQLDQVYTRGLRVLAAHVLEATWGSDHRPIIVDFEAPGSL